MQLYCLSTEGHSPVTAIPAALKLVKDAVIFIQGAELTAKVFMDLKQNMQISLHVHVNLTSLSLTASV